MSTKYLMLGGAAAAALGGAAFWASRQPGGISGMWHKMSDKMHGIHGMEGMQEGMNEDAHMDDRIMPASMYSDMPENTPAG